MTDIKKAIERLSDYMTRPMPFDGPGTVELVDEDDPDGYVAVKDRHGSPQAWMPREDYERLCSEFCGRAGGSSIVPAPVPDQSRGVNRQVSETATNKNK